MPTKLNTVEQLLLWLMYIGGSNTKSLRLIFGHLHASSIFRITDHISYCINIELDELIAWPTEEERKATHGMFSIWDKAVAVLDGTHCEIREPTYDERVYYSGYKHKHTQNYLVCVNVLGVIIKVEGPWPGRQNDRAVYNQCSLALHPEQYFSEGERVLADGGFVGGSPLIVPIHSTVMAKMQNEETKEEMKEINREFTSNRLLVEDVFSWLKARAHVLDSRFKRKREHQPEAFYAACRLHNFVRVQRIHYAMSTL
jgi:hypothetical protein